MDLVWDNPVSEETFTQPKIVWNLKIIIYYDNYLPFIRNSQL